MRQAFHPHELISWGETATAAGRLQANAVIVFAAPSRPAPMRREMETYG